MLTLNDVRREKMGKVIYILPGRQTTECHKHALAVLAKINTLRAKAETAQNKRAKVSA